MTNRLASFIGAVVALSLAACAYTPPRDENSPFSVVPVGSKLILKQPIEIPPDALAVGLSSARDPLPGVPRYQRDTDCELELRTKVPKTRTLMPGTFEVIKMVKDTEYVSLEPVKVAQIGIGVGSPAGPGWEVHSVDLFLRSADYPDVYRVHCEYKETFREGDPIGVTVLRWAMGGDFDIQLADLPPK